MGDGTFPYDVFLSHSAKDKAVVRPLAERLRADGLKVPSDFGLRTSDFGRPLGPFRFRNPLNKERRFIPLRLDEAPIKGSLAQFLYINWHQAEREQEYAKLLEACRPPAAAPKLTAEQERWAATIMSLGHTASVWSVAWSPDGRRALSGAADKTVRLWEVDSGRCLRVLEGHTAGVLSVAWSEDGRYAQSGAADNTVRVWEVESGRCLLVVEGHTAPVWSGRGGVLYR